MILVDRVGSGDPATYDIRLLAPRSWSSRKARTAALERAAQLARASAARCFTVVHASMDRRASYVPLKSGHMTITSAGGGNAEWRRYWRLYRNILRPPGQHIGLEPLPRVGQPVTEARLRIAMCPVTGEAPGGAFRVDAVPAEGAGSRDAPPAHNPGATSD